MQRSETDAWNIYDRLRSEAHEERKRDLAKTDIVETNAKSVLRFLKTPFNRVWR